MLIYCIKNKINGKCYIGQTIQPLNYRWHKHTKKGNALFNAVQKYGVSSFEVTELERCKSFSELDEKEKFYINKYNALAPNGYNLTDGGARGAAVSEITRQRLSESHKGKKWSESQRHKFLLAMTGRPCKPETKAKIAARRMGFKFTEETKQKMSVSHKGQKPWITGRTHSNDARQKMSAARKGKPLSIEHKRKISLGLLTSYAEGRR